MQLKVEKNCILATTFLWFGGAGTDIQCWEAAAESGQSDGV